MSVHWILLKILTVWLSATSATFAQTPLPPPPLPVPSVPASDREYSFEAPNPVPEAVSLPVTPNSDREYSFEAPNPVPEAVSLPVTPNSDREYSFEAPNPVPEAVSPAVPSASSNSTPSLYRVEVAGNDESLLSQVRTVEPLAFVRQREGVIHAGVFQQPQQAQQRVQALAQKGMTAQIIPVYENAGRGSWTPTRPLTPR